MSRIQINDLNHDSKELRDLSDQELLIIQGGGFFSSLYDFVHDNLGGLIGGAALLSCALGWGTCVIYGGGGGGHGGVGQMNLV